MKCAEIEESLTGYLDRELTQQETQRIDIHLAECPDCRAVLAELKRARELAGGLEIRQPSASEWKQMEEHVLERGTRKLGWIILVAWAAVTAVYALYQLAASPSEPLMVKLLVFAGLTGLTLLFVSVLLERLRESRTDRYRGVHK